MGTAKPRSTAGPRRADRKIEVVNEAPMGTSETTSPVKERPSRYRPTKEERE